MKIKKFFIAEMIIKPYLEKHFCFSVSATGTEGLEPSTFGFGDQRSTN